MTQLSDEAVARALAELLVEIDVRAEHVAGDWSYDPTLDVYVVPDAAHESSFCIYGRAVREQAAQPRGRTLSEYTHDAEVVNG